MKISFSLTMIKGKQFLVYSDLDSRYNRLSRTIVKAQRRKEFCEYTGRGQLAVTRLLAIAPKTSPAFGKHWFTSFSTVLVPLSLLERHTQYSQFERGQVYFGS